MIYLPSSNLAHKSASLSLSRTILPQTQTLNMSMRCCPAVARIALDFADLNHREELFGIKDFLSRVADAKPNERNV